MAKGGSDGKLVVAFTLPSPRRDRTSAPMNIRWVDC